ncbi:MAG: YciI family protein [Chitinophagales bacterium]
MINIFRTLICFFFGSLLLLPNSVHSQANNSKILISQATVNVPLDKAWWAWTTDKGVQSFLAADSEIDFRVDGNYKISLYTKANYPNTDNRILSFIPFQMFSFEFAMPDRFPTIRNQKTWIVVEFIALKPNQTDVKLTHLGWGKDGEWDEAYNYFQQTWLLALTDMQSNLPQAKTSGESDNSLPTVAIEDEENEEMEQEETIHSSTTTTQSSTSKYSFNPSTDDIDGVAPPTTEKPAKVATPAKKTTENLTSSLQNTAKQTDMQQFAYKLTLIDPELARNPEAWTKEQSDIVSVHFNYLKTLTEQGTVIFVGRSPDPDIGFGIVVFEAPTREAAQEIMYGDPAVKNGLMNAEFHNFNIALMRE